MNEVFNAVNGSLGSSLSQKLFYLIGRSLNKEMLFGRKISYHLKYRRNLNLFQIDTAISVIKKYNDENTSSQFYSFTELKNMTIKYLTTIPVVGIVLHHRYHDNDVKMSKIYEYLEWIKSLPNVKFATQEQIFNKYGKL